MGFCAEKDGVGAALKAGTDRRTDEQKERRKERGRGGGEHIEKKCETESLWCSRLQRGRIKRRKVRNNCVRVRSVMGVGQSDGSEDRNVKMGGVEVSSLQLELMQVSVCFPGRESSCKCVSVKKASLKFLDDLLSSLRISEWSLHFPLSLSGFLHLP